VTGPRPKKIPAGRRLSTPDAPGGQPVPRPGWPPPQTPSPRPAGPTGQKNAPSPVGALPGEPAASSAGPGWREDRSGVAVSERPTSLVPFPGGQLVYLMEGHTKGHGTLTRWHAGCSCGWSRSRRIGGTGHRRGGPVSAVRSSAEGAGDCMCNLTGNVGRWGFGHI
jgi:hypothetical protein